MHNSDIRSSIYTRKMTIIFALHIFFPQSHSRSSARSRFDFRHSQRNRGGWFPSVISNAHTHVCGGIFRRKSRTLVYNKPLFFVPFFFLLSRICGHRVRKSSSAIFCNSYPTRSRAPRIESHRLGKSSSVIFYNVCTLRSRCVPKCIPIYLPTEGARVTVLCRVVEHLSPVYR